ncbi:MAG TPA: hypothetical protein VF695_13560 [Sphingomonas sp.]
MPGLLSSLFDDQGEGVSSSSQSQEAEGDFALDLSPSVTVETDTGGSYQNLDGSTTTWENDNDVTFNADVDATLGTVLGAEDSSYQDG